MRLGGVQGRHEVGQLVLVEGGDGFTPTLFLPTPGLLGILATLTGVVLVDFWPEPRKNMDNYLVLAFLKFEGLRGVNA